MPTIPFPAQAALTTTSATIYTVPTSTTAVVKQIIIANTNAGSNWATVQAVASGSAATNSAAIVPGLWIDGNTQYQDLYFLPMLAGARLIGIANSAGLTVTVGGIEVT